jgi:hypothetical protein
MTKRRDPMDRAIESALQAGRFIGWNQGAAFVSGLGNVEREIAALAAKSPARAADLYEAFIAACNLKAEEIDDSDGEFERLQAPSSAAGFRRDRRPAPIQEQRLRPFWPG